MMSAVIIEELRTIGIAFVSGVFITFIYDLLRVFRRIIAHGNLWIGVEDFLFWIWTSFWIFSVLYRTNDGSLRIYTILAMVLGMIIYHKTVSEPFVRITGGFLKKILRFLVLPLKKLWKAIIMKKNR